MPRKIDRSKQCKIAQCQDITWTTGLCAHHFKSLERYGDPHIHKRVRRGTDARFYLHPSGYMQRRFRGKHQFEHTFIMEQYLGRKLLPHENVHHINGVKHDNRLENLELWSTHQPPGQRIVDKVRWARTILATYSSEDDDEYHGM